MAGESAREVARRAREQAERLNKRAELFEQGAEGEAETARALATLPPGWTVLHDLRWPGRRLANVDHVVIGPSGIFVIDSKNWTGRITTAGGTLRQNSYNREAVAGAADAALAVAEHAGAYAPFVHGVITFAGRDDVSARCRDVAVCCTANLLAMLQGWPAQLTPEQVADASLRLDLVLRSATETSSQPRPRSRPQTRPSIGRAVFDAASRPPAPARRSRRSSSRRRREPSLARFFVGVALLFGLIAVGPQLASGLGAALSEQLTNNLGEPGVATCATQPTKRAEASKQQRSENQTSRGEPTAAGADC